MVTENEPGRMTDDGDEADERVSMGDASDALDEYMDEEPSMADVAADLGIQDGRKVEETEGESDG